MMNYDLRLGHRERMRERLYAFGAQTLADYELLELLLFSLIKRRDTRGTARLLLSSKGFSQLFKMSRDELLSVSGVGKSTAEFLGCIGEYINRKPRNGGFAPHFGSALLREKILNSAKKCEENALFIYAFDNSEALIGEELIFEGTLSSGALRPKAAIDAAIRMRAAFVLVVSLRPYGAPYPSGGEREGFKMLSSCLADFGIPARDCLIASGGEIFSFSGLAFEPGTTFSVGEEITLKEELLPLLSYTSSAPSTEAQAIFEKFSVRENLYAAGIDEIYNLIGNKMSAELLTVTAHIAARKLAEPFLFGKDRSESALADYISSLFLTRSNETVFVLSFRDDKFIGADVVTFGTVNSASLSLRTVAECAAARSAEKIILAHNHPFGTSEPSDEDIAATRALRDALGGIGIELFSHYISSPFGVNKITAKDL